MTTKNQLMDTLFVKKILEILKLFHYTQEKGQKLLEEWIKFTNDQNNKKDREEKNQ